MLGEQEPSHRSPRMMYAPKTRSIYLEYERGIIANTVSMVGGLVDFDLDAEGNVLGTECFLGSYAMTPALLEDEPLQTLQS